MTEPGRTVVFFHAHPDDEAIFTGGTMALLAAAGWRVVLVVATAGEQGLTSAGVRPQVPPALRPAAQTAPAGQDPGGQRIEGLRHPDPGGRRPGPPPGGRLPPC